MTDYCNNCIRQKVCYLSTDNKEGWCEKCNFCPEKDCVNTIKYRVYWGSSFSLYRDICENHINANDCHCSKNCEKQTEPFIYKK